MTYKNHNNFNEDEVIKSFKANTSFWRASTNWFNLLMILFSVYFVGASLNLLFLFIFQRNLASAIFSGLFLLGSILFLFFQLWGMYTLSIELTEQGIIYKISYRKIFINWNEIKSVKFESRKKQITFWLTENKLQRIHYFGLRPSDFTIIHGEIMKQVNDRSIDVK